MLLQITFAFIGTIAFALLFHVPRPYYLTCGVTGTLGWSCYLILAPSASPAEAAFFATALVALLSRFFAIRERCPVTIFLISGILPLVPGGGIYWTSYYLLQEETELSSAKGFETIKVAVAMVLGIVFVFELPQKLFRIFIPHPKRSK